MFIYLFVILTKVSGLIKANCACSSSVGVKEQIPEKNYGTFRNRGCIYPDLHFVSVVSAGASWLKKKKENKEKDKHEKC
ncbi:MAG: hypothetical protein CMG66_03005 [Candidatus Marinimicrobia bacterium]|nr:hypothetical protein [Candidatus Neomarinimicrobiota bacterium]|tara:strand:+ start:8335 stop:8571 length:237 start_codon:yes stop_codon:yes gene_type:complete